MSPQGLLRFTLPGLSPSATAASRAKGALPVSLGLDRVVVDGDGGRHGEVVLVWSGGLRLPRDLYDLGDITITLN